MRFSQLLVGLGLVPAFPVASLSASSMPLKVSFHDCFLEESKMRIVSHLWETGSLIITISADADMSGKDSFWESLEPSEMDDKSSCLELGISDTVRHVLERTGRHVARMLAEFMVTDREPVRTTRNLSSMDSGLEGWKFCTTGTLSRAPWELEEAEDVSSTPDVPPGWHLRAAVPNSSKADEVIVHFDRQRLLPLEEVSKSSFKIYSHDNSLFYGRTYKFLPDRSVTLETRPDVSDEKEGHVEQLAEEPFCMDMGMAMVMFLRGFRSPLNSKEMLPCLSYYVSSWVLNDEGKFKGAMVYSFLLGLLTQGLTVMLVVVSVNVKKQKLKKYLRVVIYVLQVFMGYILMLIPMTYSVELLLSVVAGLVFGYFLFHKGEPRSTQSSSTRLREPLLTGNRSTLA